MFNIIKNQLLGHCFLHIKRFCSKSCENGGQVYDSILDKAINKQINRELNASHEYFSIGQHFLQRNVNRSGFGAFFLNQSSDELKHAHSLCDFHHKRGGNVQIFCIDSPKHSKTLNPVDAVNFSLDLETEALNSLKNLHDIATKCNDISAVDFIGGTLIKNQVDEIHELHLLLMRLKQFSNNDIGLYLIDRELLKRSRKHGNASH